MIEKAPFIEKTNDSIPLLVKLEADGTLQKIQDEYLYWDSVKYKAKNCEPLALWKAIKFQRYLKSKTIYFGNYNFQYMVTDYLHRALHHFDLHIGGNLGSNIGIAETDKTKFVISAMVEEAISSSQMEGANTTRKKAKEMIQKEQKPISKSEQMIMNNFITMKYIIEHKQDEFTIQNILNIHKLISNQTLANKEEEGRLRDNNEIYVVDHVSSEVVHMPPLAIELEKLMEDLCDFCNRQSESFIHPIIKGCIVHFMIGWIHPFTDGNGRTARALFYWYMIKQGYWLIEYLSISKIIKETKAQYEKAFLYTEMDDNDMGYFITYHIKMMERAFEALKDYINHKQKEVFQAAKFMQIPNVNDRMAQILKILHEDSDRILNTKEIESRFNTSNFTARSDLKMLVQLGFLDIIQVNKKKQNFIKTKDFDKVMSRYGI